MKTDPTTSISGVAGLPLSNDAIQLERQSIAQTDQAPQKNDAISDTLETSDREGDGRQAWDANRTQTDQAPSQPDSLPSGEEQNQLDLRV